MCCDVLELDRHIHAAFLVDLEERDDSDESHPEPKERVDPYIDERYLATHPDTKPTSAKRDHPLS